MATGGDKAGEKSRALRSVCLKTKMCKFFLTGQCNKSDKCTYAHNVEELTKPPDLHQTKLCPSMLQSGFCPDQSCMFAHSREELRSVKLSEIAAKKAQEEFMKLYIESDQMAFDFPQSLDVPDGVPAPWNGATAGDPALMGMNTDVPEVPIPSNDVARSPGTGLRNKFHKTKSCKFFEAGRCRKDPCNFAHGRQEMEETPDLSRTKICPTVICGGRCMDFDCRYAHSRSELRQLPKPWKPQQQNANFDQMMHQVRGVEKGMESSEAETDHLSSLSQDTLDFSKYRDDSESLRLVGLDTLIQLGQLGNHLGDSYGNSFAPPGLSPTDDAAPGRSHSPRFVYGDSAVPPVTSKISWRKSPDSRTSNGSTYAESGDMCQHGSASSDDLIPLPFGLELDAKRMPDVTTPPFSASFPSDLPSKVGAPPWIEGGCRTPATSGVAFLVKSPNHHAGAGCLDVYHV